MRQVISHALGLFLFVHTPALFAQPQPQTVRLAVRQPVRLLEPANAVQREERLLAHATYEGLTTLAPDNLAVVGGVAESWRLNTDRRTYMFFIRPEARWSNGKKVIADDFIAGWRRVLLHPEDYPEAHLLLNSISNTRVFMDLQMDQRGTKPASELSDKSISMEVEAIAENTLKVTLAQPREDFPYLLSLPIFFPRPSWLKPDDPIIEGPQGQRIGNGAFVIEEANEQHILLGRNQSYWGKRQVQIDQIDLQILPDAFQVAQNFKLGNLHWNGTVDLSPTKQGTISGYRGYFYLQLNNSARNAFEAAGLRRALSLAIKRPTLQQYVAGNSISGGVGFYPRGNDQQGPYYLMAYLPNDAEKELRALGYCGKQASSECKKLPEVEIHYAGSDFEKKLALSVCNMWQTELQLGCKTLPLAEVKEQVGETKPSFTLKETTAWLPSLGAFLENWTQYADKTYNLRLRGLLATKGGGLTPSTLRQLERLLVTDMPVIPLIETQELGRISTQILGFYHNRLDIHPLKYIYFGTRSSLH